MESRIPLKNIIDESMVHSPLEHLILQDWAVAVLRHDGVPTESMRGNEASFGSNMFQKMHRPFSASAKQDMYIYALKLV